MATIHRDPIVVLGGGIIGVATAAGLSARGERVTLLTDGKMATGASGRSLSWLNSLDEHPTSYRKLRHLGIEKYRRFADNHGNPPYIRFDGGVFWGTDNAEITSLEAHLNDHDYRVEILSTRQLAERNLGVSLDAVPSSGVLWAPDEGWVDLPSIIGQLVREFIRDGGVLIENAGRSVVESSDRRVTGVTAPSGQRIPTDRVVVATGADVPEFAAQFGLTVRSNSPISVLVRTRPVITALTPVINSPRIAVRPNIAGNLVLDHNSASEAVIVMPDGRYDVPQETIQELLLEASKVIDGHPHLELESFGAGPKPVPGDGYPVVGELSSLAGCFVAFTHSGATLGLILGEILADEVLGERATLLDNFRPDRFGSE